MMFLMRQKHNKKKKDLQFVFDSKCHFDFIFTIKDGAKCTIDVHEFVLWNVCVHNANINLS